MTRLRRFAASARQVRSRRFAATARLATAWLAAMWLVSGETLLACPMCFGAEETSMIDGTKLGIVVMLGITLAVQAAFVAFFLYLRKHAKRAAEMETP